MIGKRMTIRLKRCLIIGLLILHAWIALSTTSAAMREWEKAWAMYMPAGELKKFEILISYIPVYQKRLVYDSKIIPQQYKALPALAFLPAVYYTYSNPGKAMGDSRSHNGQGTGARPEAAARSDSQKLTSLVENVLEDHNRLRSIISLLYDEDMSRRFMAAKALGEIARLAPDLMKQRWERIFRAFDDTMSCWGAAEALGEVGRNLPQHRKKIVMFLRGFRKDDCSCQGYIWGMCRICQVDSAMIKDFIAELEDFLASRNVCMTGQALWALGELGMKEAVGKIKSFLSDGRETWLFENEQVSMKSIGRIAEEAIRKLELSGDISP